MNSLKIWNRIVIERRRQELLLNQGKFEFTASDPGISNTLKLPILIEEVGEVAKCINESMSKDELKKELTQVAAVAVAWLESL